MPRCRIAMLGLLLILAPRLFIANTLEVEITGAPPYEHAIWRAVAMKFCRLPSSCDEKPYHLKHLIVPHGGKGNDFSAASSDIRHASMDFRESTRLYVSNSPERVYDYRTLFEGSLPPDISIRALYHHQNNARASIAFFVEIINPTSSLIRVHIIDADAGPGYDECLVGHQATIAFARRQDANSGYVLTVPAFSVSAPVRTVMPPGSTISGIMRLQTVTQGIAPIMRMRTGATAEQSGSAKITQYIPSAVFGDFQYDNAAVNYRGTYSVGGNWLFAPLGEHAIPATRPGQDLEGAYGVWHTYELTAENHTLHAAKVELAVAAVGGPARLTYSFGDGWRATDVLRPNKQHTLLSFMLHPGGRRVIRLSTMPQSGSYYPLQFILKSTDPPGLLSVGIR